MWCSNFIASSNTRRHTSTAWGLETDIPTTGWERRKTAVMKQLHELFKDLSPSKFSFPGSCYSFPEGVVLMKQIRTEQSWPGPAVTLQPCWCWVNSLMLRPAWEGSTLSVISTGSEPSTLLHSSGATGDGDVSGYSVLDRESPNPGFIISGVASTWTSAPKVSEQPGLALWHHPALVASKQSCHLPLLSAHGVCFL